MDTADSFNSNHHKDSGDDVGLLVAAVPHLLGYFPTDSLVVLGVPGGDRATGRLAMRIDLPDPAETARAAEGLAWIASRNSVAQVALVVVAPAGDLGDLPRRDLVDRCRDRFAHHNIAVLEQLWIATTSRSGPWRCYQHPECDGVMPDPGSTELAAEFVAAGAVTYRHRDEIAAVLAPEPHHVLARRAKLLDSLHSSSAADDVQRDYARVIGAIERAKAGVLPSSDQDIVDLTRALADSRVRDACLFMGDRETQRAAGELWRCLVRATPSPDRAQVAVLAAFAAYCGGEGVLATIAVDLALSDESDHPLAGQLRDAFAIGYPPERLREAGSYVVRMTRADLGVT